MWNSKTSPLTPSNATYTTALQRGVTNYERPSRLELLTRIQELEYEVRRLKERLK